MTGRMIVPLLVPIALLITACPPRLALTLYNNSGADVSVSIDDRRLAWPAGETFRISPEAEPVRWEELKWEPDPQRQVEAPVLVIESAGRVGRYRLAIPGLPDAYVDSRTGVKERFLQLEADGRLYVIRAGASFPVDPLPAQPPGFPIERVADESSTSGGFLEFESIRRAESLRALAARGPLLD